MVSRRREFGLTGHRGAMGVAPENTLASFRRAVADGATEIELDLRVTADGELVVLHDAEVDRTTDGTGAVAEMTLAQVQRLDAGDGERIPTFADVLAAVETPVQAEIKALEAVDLLVGAVRSDPGLMSRVNPTSFHVEAVQRVIAALPEATVGLISAAASLGVIEQAATLGARRVLLGWNGVDSALVGAAHERGLQIGVWPVNSPDELHRAIELQIDRVTTNYPSLLRECGYRITGGLLQHR